MIERRDGPPGGRAERGPPPTAGGQQARLCIADPAMINPVIARLQIVR
jgi:hypothetical protein